jgi:hypothetical protein
MKNILILFMGALIGALALYIVLDRDAEEAIDYIPEDLSEIKSGATLQENQAESLFKNYIVSEKVRLRTFRGIRRQHRNKHRITRLSSEMLGIINNANATLKVDSMAVVPGKTDNQDLNAIYGAILVVYYSGEIQGDSVITTASRKRYFYVEDADRRSPTCPVECDQGNYTNPPW